MGKTCVHVNLSPKAEFTWKQMEPKRRECFLHLKICLFDFLIAFGGDSPIEVLCESLRAGQR